jgi:hypothetical protein
MEVLALIFLTPPATLLAGIAVMITRRFRLLPVGVPDAMAVCLTISANLTIMLLLLTMDMLVRRPARLQQEAMGRQVVGPLSLRRYEAFGFQDVQEQWTYDLTETDRKRTGLACPRPIHPAAQGCLLGRAGKEDEEWSITATAENGRMKLEFSTW